MMTSTWTFVIGGCLLGIAQLAAGIAIGLWFRRPDRAAAKRSRQDLLDASRIAQRLRALAGEVSSSVGEHQVQLQHASERLSSECTGDSLDELVVDVIGGIVQANHSLQFKLDTAEHRLQEQAAEIEVHISRSLTDSLTGLPNRREFNERLEERMAGWNRRGEVFSLFVLDVDHFKRLNDLHGHLAGDTVLTVLGRTLRSAMRRDDVAARYGGEEFAMILPGTTLAQAEMVVPKLRDAIGRLSIDHGGRRLCITASGGWATVQEGETAESLFERADAALYAAKSAGRDCAFLHDGAMCRPIDGAEPKCSETDPLTEDGPTSATSSLIASFPYQEPISDDLAQTCEALREYVQRRSALDQDPMKS